MNPALDPRQALSKRGCSLELGPWNLELPAQAGLALPRDDMPMRFRAETPKSSAKMIPGSCADFFIKKSLKARRGNLGTRIMCRGWIRYAGGIFDLASILGAQGLAYLLSKNPDFQKSGAHERVDIRFDPANCKIKSDPRFARKIFSFEPLD